MADLGKDDELRSTGRGARGSKKSAKPAGAGASQASPSASNAAPQTFGNNSRKPAGAPQASLKPSHSPDGSNVRSSGSSSSGSSSNGNSGSGSAGNGAAPFQSTSSSASANLSRKQTRNVTLSGAKDASVEKPPAEQDKAARETLWGSFERKTVLVPTKNKHLSVERTDSGFRLSGESASDDVAMALESGSLTEQPSFGGIGLNGSSREMVAQLADSKGGGKDAAATGSGGKRKSVRMKSEQDQCEMLAQESEEGKIEYKWKLIGKSPERIAHLVTQMNYRLKEGLGEAIYELGILDDGFPQGLSDEELAASISTIKHMAAQLKCDVVVLRIANGHQGKVAEVLVRKLSIRDFVDIRVSVLGNVDSGKSTLVGVLTGGELANGRGLARMNVFRHRHEVENGRTTSISHQILGFDAKGNITNTKEGDGFRKRGWAEIVEDSVKVVTFLDLAGHERYLNTTLLGLTGQIPDYCCVVVGANNGVTRMTKEHLGLALTLRIPIFIVVTKIDLAPANVLQETVETLRKILTTADVNKQPVIVRTSRDVLPLLANKQLAATSNSLCPIFLASSVSGKGLKALKTFLNLLPKQKDWSQEANAPTEFSIDDSYSVDGVGTVVTGMVLKGGISIDDQLLMGPSNDGEFSLVTIKGIHIKKTAVKRAVAGQAASLALKKVKRAHVRKGMALLDPQLKPRACIGFDAKIQVLSHPTQIQSNYEPVVHCGTIKQSAKVVSLSSEALKTGDKASVRFDFLYRPEYLQVGARIIFRENRTKGTGKIVRLHYYDENKDKLTFRTPRSKLAKQARKGKPSSDTKSSSSSSSSSASAATSSAKSGKSNSQKKADRKTSVDSNAMTDADDGDEKRAGKPTKKRKAGSGKKGSGASSMGAAFSFDEDEEEEEEEEEEDEESGGGSSKDDSPSRASDSNDDEAAADNDNDNDEEDDDDDQEDDADDRLFGPGGALGDLQKRALPPGSPFSFPTVAPQTLPAASSPTSRGKSGGGAGSGGKSGNSSNAMSSLSLGAASPGIGLGNLSLSSPVSKSKSLSRSSVDLAPARGARPLSNSSSSGAIAIGKSNSGSKASPAHGAGKAGLRGSVDENGVQDMELGSPTTASGSDLLMNSPRGDSKRPTSADGSSSSSSAAASSAGPRSPALNGQPHLSVLSALPADNPLLKAVLARPEEIGELPVLPENRLSRRDRKQANKANRKERRREKKQRQKYQDHLDKKARLDSPRGAGDSAPSSSAAPAAASHTSASSSAAGHAPSAPSPRKRSQNGLVESTALSIPQPRTPKLKQSAGSSAAGAGKLNLQSPSLKQNVFKAKAKPSAPASSFAAMEDDDEDVELQVEDDEEEESLFG